MCERGWEREKEKKVNQKEKRKSEWEGGGKEKCKWEREKRINWMRVKEENHREKGEKMKTNNGIEWRRKKKETRENGER